MKLFITIVSLAIATVGVSAVGPVDPAKLPIAWCNIYKEDACLGGAVPAACGANSTYSSSCKSTFSNDFVCTSFQVSCLCTPKEGGEQKDVSMDAFNRTFEGSSYNMCGNLIPLTNSTGPGIVSGDYKPDGKRPKDTSTTSGSPPASTNDVKSGASAIQMSLSTGTLALLSLGLAMVPL
ncbi:hypothetical protein BX616_010207 [Lobosporangium transversale]|uniref:Extracellular membrane protein CFEM domain-containing protein n=1 Tax=Lobosporangium transversale TaxID=64571 RepID=A0A1Y2GLN6_9FUNG|nr:hypothetical protein BCR41DRAFT_354267 [Lobosporangium transversale]KAF9918110.1 hypothetical protein BX616_010207 [Lobosporangium transversale]ORZ14884.1 hypothetical protein BCR41DRAFT_354267 [Lobosporangium transversale]|eukprot:XP_021881016.1 hypothetical protein BCR41DRAFT_354267 [Lobosporangium transversale]